jgi:DNA-binding NtrC family response regulator
MAEGREITPHDLGLTRDTTQEGGDPLDSLKVAQRRIEMEMIVKGISTHRGNLTRVARDLEVSRTTLYRKLREYNLHSLVPPVSSSSSVSIPN